MGLQQLPLGEARDRKGLVTLFRSQGRTAPILRAAALPWATELVMNDAGASSDRIERDVMSMLMLSQDPLMAVIVLRQVSSFWGCLGSSLINAGARSLPYLIIVLISSVGALSQSRFVFIGVLLACIAPILSPSVGACAILWHSLIVDAHLGCLKSLGIVITR